MRTKCACKVSVTYQFDEVAKTKDATNLKIDFCPLHMAAPDLLKFAKMVVVWAAHGRTGGELNFEAIEFQARDIIRKAEEVAK